MNSEKKFKAFGDSLLNFLYSLAKSRASGTWTGEKVSNSVLSQALIASKVDQPGGLDKHEKGDFVEAYIAQAWIEKVITTDEAVDVLVKSLKRHDLEREEKKAVVEAFKDLLNCIEKKR